MPDQHDTVHALDLTIGGIDKAKQSRRRDALLLGAAPRQGQGGGVSGGTPQTQQNGEQKGDALQQGFHTTRPRACLNWD